MSSLVSELFGEPLGHAYIFQEVIGTGSMGRVYRGICKSGGPDVAIKVLRPELSEDPTFLSRFVQERSILTRLAGQGVVRVDDLIVERGRLAIVMELVGGGSMREYLTSHGGLLSESEACCFMTNVFSGLGVAHSLGVIHRDVKPENILIDNSALASSAKLTDFGVSGIANASLVTRLTGFVGTPAYMAPELSDPEPATPAVDVYAAGIVLYETISGRVPFPYEHPMAILKAHLTESISRPPQMSKAVWNVTERLLDRDPRNRPTAVEAARLLSVFVRGASLSANSPAGRSNDTVVRPRLSASHATSASQDNGVVAPTITSPTAHRDRAHAGSADLNRLNGVRRRRALIATILAVTVTCAGSIIYVEQSRNSPSSSHGLSSARTLSIYSQAVRTTNDRPTLVYSESAWMSWSGNSMEWAPYRSAMTATPVVAVTTVSMSQGVVKWVETWLFTRCSPTQPCTQKPLWEIYSSAQGSWEERFVANSFCWVNITTAGSIIGHPFWYTDGPFASKPNYVPALETPTEVLVTSYYVEDGAKVKEVDTIDRSTDLIVDSTTTWSKTAATPAYTSDQIWSEPSSPAAPPRPQTNKC